MKNPSVLFRAFFAIMFCSLASWSAAAPSIELPGGVIYALARTGPAAGVRISINVNPPAILPELAKIVAAPCEVSGPNGQPPELLGEFTTKLDPNDGFHSLVVSVPKAEDIPPGLYTLKIRFDARNPAEGPAPAALPPPLTISLTLAGTAQLDTPSAIVIGLEKGVFFADSPVPGKLVLHEQGKAALDFTVSDQPAPPAGPWLRRGTLAFSPGTGLIFRGHAFVVDVSPQGKYSLGKSTGNLIVHSPNLGAPVTVAYTLLVRRAPVWIIFWAISGLGAGWLVRVALKNGLALAQARLAASQFVALMEAALRATPDSTFQSKVQAILTDLRGEAETSKDAAALTTAVSTAKSALDGAQTELNGRSQALQTRLAVVHGELFRTYVFPAAVEAAAQMARAGCLSAETLLAGRDVAGAQTLFDGDLARALTALGQTAGRWRAATGEYLAKLQADPPALGDAETATLKSGIGGWLITFASFERPPDFTPETLAPALMLAHTACCHALNHIDFIAREGGLFAQAIGSQFTPPVPDLTAALVESAQRQADGARADLDAAQPDLQQPFVRRQRQVGDWLAAFTKVLPAQPDLQAIKSTLDKGEWAAAAAQAQQQRALLPFGDEGTDAGDELPVGAPLGAKDPNQGSIVFRSEYAAENGARPFRGNMPFILTGSSQQQADLRQQSNLLMFCQTAIVGVFFLALAYRNFANDWVGDFWGALGVFAWGFFVDLSADGVLPLLRKVIPTGAATAEH